MAKIELSKEQYQNLLKLCYLGNWMANAQRTGTKDDPMVQKYEDIYEYIQSLAPANGSKDLVKWDEVCKRYFATQEFEFAEDVQGIIEEYDDNNFWDELIERMTDRDFDKAFTKKEREKMSFEEYCTNRLPFEKKWNEEIYKHGLTKLVIRDKK